jgi:superfamily II DNA or RNA helicase
VAPFYVTEEVLHRYDRASMAGEGPAKPILLGGVANGRSRSHRPAALAGIREELGPGGHSGGNKIGLSHRAAVVPESGNLRSYVKVNFIRTRPSAPELLECYNRLRPGPKMVLRMKSLIFLPTGKTDFLDCLTRGALRMPDGKAWSSRSVNPALEELLALKLLTEDLGCPASLLHPVAVDAAASRDAAALFAAVRAAFQGPRTVPYYSVDTLDPDVLGRSIRLAIYANDGPDFIKNRNLFDREWGLYSADYFLAALVAGVPLAIEWLASRQAAIQHALLEAKVAGALSGGVPEPDLPALISHCRERQDQEGHDGIRRLLLQYDLLAGKLDDLLRSAAAIEDAASDERLVAEGAVAFLEGRNEAAIQHYKLALKLFRKHVGKRKVFLPGLHGLFFLMALLGANDASLHAEMQVGIDTATSNPSLHLGGFRAIQAMLLHVQGLELRARELLATLHKEKSTEPLSVACIALAKHAIEPALTREERADLVARFEHWQETLPVIARIYAEILAETADASGPHQAYLTATGPRLGVNFAKLVQTRQPWERALESLTAFLGAATLKAGTVAAVRKAKRLVWFVDPETRSVEVAEQSAKGRAGWTDGRSVAMKRLHEQDPRLDYLTEQDRAALRSIRKDLRSWYGEETFYFELVRTLPLLVGHTAVFDARFRSQPLELVAYPVELVVTEQQNGYHVALSHTAAEPTVFLEAETQSRYRVVEFSQQLLSVQEILGAHGLTVPYSARDQVVAMVRQNHPTMPIRADIAEATQTGTEGISTPVVQLVPFGGGLKLNLLVRPFGADGPAYVAGLGGRSVLASVGGEQRRANRDLPAELAARSALVASCPILRDRAGADAHEVIVEDLEGSLELLVDLQTYPGVVSVEWPEGHKLRVSPVAPDKLKLRVAQDRDWFNVEGTISLDEEQVLEMRFLLERLDRAQGRFVPLGDGRFVALTRQLQAQLQRLAAVSESHRSGRRVHALGATALDAVLEEAGEVKADTAWTRHVTRIRAAEGWTPKLPATLQGELRDYQVDGFAWLSRLARWGAGACLADDMGLGKTVQAIAVILDRAGEGPCLVVAPTSVCPNWEVEIARFAPTLTTRRLATADDRAALVTGLGSYEVLICSYGLLHQEAALLAGRAWQMVVLDEAQAIKNAETKRAQASLSLQAGFRLALTGTPVENYLDELWSLFGFVNPGLLGSRESFQKRFALPIERDRDAYARQALRALIRPFLLRRTKAAVLSELPPRTEQTVQVEMTDTERAFYQALRQRALENIAALDAPKGKRKIHILAEITRLRRACCNPALIDAGIGVPSGKLDAFLDLVQELIRNRHRALVFSQFVGHLSLVRQALDARGIRYEYLDGSTPSAERERRVAAFQSGVADLFLISLRAGGTGLNLTAADYVVHLDPWWNPAVEDQASDRAYRIGQERPVTIYRLIMQDSIEERIVHLHHDKRDLASDLLEGTETTARLNEEELLDLIRA